MSTNKERLDRAAFRDRNKTHRKKKQERSRADRRVARHDPEKAPTKRGYTGYET
jgi:hypothetical protein